MAATHQNPPQLPALAYRLGTHPTILQRLLQRLPLQEVPSADGQGPRRRPLGHLTARHTDDLAVALLDGWAVLADVLTFYQERLANEGYLRTATEHLSVQALAHTLGYELQPGLAASTSLAFTVDTAAGMDPVVRLAPGLKVQSIPGQDQRPQVFETVEALEARPDWNVLKPARPLVTVPQALTAQATALRLAGTASGLRPGDRFLLRDAQAQQSYLPVIQAVDLDPAANQTHVLWGSPLSSGTAVSLAQSQVYAFRQRAALFGRQAPPFTLPEGGVFVRKDTGWAQLQAGLPEQPVQALLSAEGALFAATAGAGIYRSADGGSTWQPCNSGLTNLTVYSLCADEVILYAGTADGSVFRSLDHGDTWMQWASGALLERKVQTGQPDVISVADFGLPKTPVRALCFLDTQLYAGTDDGVYQWDMTKAQWKCVLAATAVRALLASPGTNDTLLCAGAAPGTLFALKMQTPPLKTDLTPQALSGAVIRALAADSLGGVLAGTSAGVYQRGSDNATWTSLATAGLPSSDVRALAIAAPQQYLVAIPPGRLVERPWPSTVLASGQRSIDLDATYNGVLVGSYVALVQQEHVAVGTVTAVTTGQRTDFAPPATVTRLELAPDIEPALAPFYGTDPRRIEVWLASAPLALPVQPLDAPVTGTEIALDRQIPDLEAGRRLIVSDPQHSEVVFVEGTRLQESQTVVTLRAPGLQYAYDRAAVTIHANVVPATHGETVVQEVLGSGDGAQSHQRFLLKHTPLTYVPAATDSGAQSTLSVRVNDVLWDEAPSLHTLAADSRCYVVQRDAQGRTSIMFGDGVHGARLPSGSENVVATYRQGLGPEGNVNAHSLTLLQMRPLGVQQVTNPLPASGAAAPEARDQARQRAPWTVLTMDRLVALADFEHFTSTFAGIGLAQATLLRTPEGRLVHLTIADSTGSRVPADSALCHSLLKALDQRRNPLQSLRLDTYEPVDVGLEATVYVDAHYRPESVQQAVRTALHDAFTFGKRAFGQMVTSAELVVLMQGVPGVVAVALQRLTRTPAAATAETTSDACPDQVPAYRARWREGRIQPAELLRLSTERITLRMEMAS